MVGGDKAEVEINAWGRPSNLRLTDKGTNNDSAPMAVVLGGDDVSRQRALP